MLETSARLLRLLSLLQTRRDWTGAELAERLGVSSRTIRTDIERLRTLGYPVHATSGAAGGYRLGAGAALPPLLLDDDEAVAVAVGLRTAAGGSVTGIEETSLRALAKLEQVLPSRLRHRVTSLQEATVSIPGGGPTVSTEVLTTIAATIRASERLRFDYTGHDGTPSRREAEPHRLVTWGRRWYLVAWDNERADWRTFRVDRITPKTPNGPRFTPRPLPHTDVAEYVQRGVGAATWRVFARLRLYAPAEQVRPKLLPAITLESDGPDRCIAEVGSDTAGMLALYVGLLDIDFDILEAAPGFAEHLTTLADRLHRAVASAGSVT